MSFLSLDIMLPSCTVGKICCFNIFIYSGIVISRYGLLIYYWFTFCFLFLKYDSLSLTCNNDFSRLERKQHMDSGLCRIIYFFFNKQRFFPLIILTINQTGISGRQWFSSCQGHARSLMWTRSDTPTCVTGNKLANLHEDCGPKQPLLTVFFFFSLTNMCTNFSHIY